MKKTPRDLSPYEETQLARYGKPASALDDTTAPVEYITGKAEFCDHVFTVNQDVLIPRIETEELVSTVISAVETKKSDKLISIIDVGTGSGAIAISIAAELTKKRIPFTMTATEVSQKALNMAQRNAQTILGDDHGISFIHTSLLSDVDVRADIIVANLPYIPSERIAYLDASVKDHEPHLALDGGADGLELIRELLEQAKTKLAPSGILFMEVDHTHTRDTWSEFFADWEVTITHDTLQHTRFAQLTHNHSSHTK